MTRSAVEPTTAAGRPARPGAAPTKAERKEQARLEREEIQRRMASKRRARTLGIVMGAVVVAAIVAAASCSLGRRLPGPRAAPRRRTSAADPRMRRRHRRPRRAIRPTRIACTSGAGDIAGPPLSAYPTTPPRVRPARRRDHSRPGVYVPRPSRPLPVDPLPRARCHGDLVRPGRTGGDVAQLIEFYDRRLQAPRSAQDR